MKSALCTIPTHCFTAMRASTPVPTLPACAFDRSPLPPLIPNKSSVLFYFVAIAARERQASGAWVAISRSGLVCSGWARPYHGSDASSPAHAYRHRCRVIGARVLAGKYIYAECIGTEPPNEGIYFFTASAHCPAPSALQPALSSLLSAKRAGRRLLTAAPACDG